MHFLVYRFNDFCRLAPNAEDQPTTITTEIWDILRLRKKLSCGGVGWVKLCDVQNWVKDFVFVTALSRKLSHKTIRVYLSGRQYFSIKKGYTERIAQMGDLQEVWGREQETYKGPTSYKTLVPTFHILGT